MSTHAVDPALDSQAIALRATAGQGVLVQEASHHENEHHDIVASSNAQASRRKPKTALAMTGLFFTLFIAALNATIVATAVPTICAQLHSTSGFAWISGAYLLGNCAACSVWVKLSDIWGRKPILLTATGMYFFTTIFCALAVSMNMLIVGRALQGAAGGGLISLVYIAISDAFSERERSLYLGMLELVWAIAGGTGPVLGGVFTQTLSWRWIFWINLPVSATAFLLLLLFLDVPTQRTSVAEGLLAVDWFGSLSILGLVAMLLLGLNFGGEQLPWNSPVVICLLTFGALSGGFFLFSEARLARYPLMPLALFRKKSTVAILVLGFAQDWVTIAGEFFMPLFFQSAKGLSPVSSGSLILPITLAQALTGIFSGFIMHRTGRYLELIRAGTIFLALGTGLFILLNPRSSLVEIVIFEVLAAAGGGLLFQPPVLALQVLVAQADVATATGTLAFVNSAAGCLSILLGGIVFQNSVSEKVPGLQVMGLNETLAVELRRNAAANVEDVLNIHDSVLKYAVQEAFVSGIRSIWYLCLGVAACGCIASILVPKRTLSTDHPTDARPGVHD